MLKSHSRSEPFPMPTDFSRRMFLGGSGALLAHGLLAKSQAAPAASTSAVSLINGEDRRKIVHDALEAIDDQIRPALKRKKYVTIKPNNVSTVNQLAA